MNDLWCTVYSVRFLFVVYTFIYFLMLLTSGKTARQANDGQEEQAYALQRSNGWATEWTLVKCVSETLAIDLHDQWLVNIQHWRPMMVTG